MESAGRYLALVDLLRASRDAGDEATVLVCEDALDALWERMNPTERATATTAMQVLYFASTL